MIEEHTSHMNVPEPPPRILEGMAGVSSVRNHPFAASKHQCQISGGAAEQRDSDTVRTVMDSGKGRPKILANGSRVS
jgi:hypothetical protein